MLNHIIASIVTLPSFIVRSKDVRTFLHEKMPMHISASARFEDPVVDGVKKVHVFSVYILCMFLLIFLLITYTTTHVRHF